MFIADTQNTRVREVKASSDIISTVAGTGDSVYNGDGIAATSSNLYNPMEVSVDSSGE